MAATKKKRQPPKGSKKGKAPTGRPTECTPKMIGAMADAIRAGLSIERACFKCRIHVSSYMLWRSRGTKGEAPYSDFLVAIEKAKSDREEEWLADIRDAAKPDASGKRQWQAAAWLLERTNAADWARPAQRVIVETMSDPEATAATKEQLVAAALKAAKSERAKRGD